jgi:hypothetical protein
MREISKQLRALIALIAILTLGSAGAAAEPEDERASILLLDVGPQLGTRTDTLRVHLSDVARLVVEQATDLPTTQQRVQTAVARCRALGAAAAVFVEDLSGVQLRVYWVEPRRGRVWMRELAIGSDGFEAASEKAALVARGGIQELLEAGRLSTAPLLSVEPQEPVVVRSVPPRAPTPSEPPRWALGAGYHGTSPIEEAAWQHGLQLLGSYRFVGPLYLAGRYTVAPGLTVEHAAGAAELARHPAELGFGYRAPWRVAFRAELGMFVEHLVRHTTRVDGGQRPTTDSQRFLLGASARMGLDLHVRSRIRLVGLFGAQVPFNHFNYLAVDDPDGSVAIHVRVVRPLVELGLVIDLW